MRASNGRPAALARPGLGGRRASCGRPPWPPADCCRGRGCTASGGLGAPDYPACLDGVRAAERFAVGLAAYRNLVVIGGQLVTEQLPNTGNRNALNPATVYRVIGVGLVAVSSGLLVPFLHQLPWTWGLPIGFAGVVACVYVGGVFGVPSGSTVLTAAATAGCLEGAYRGWQAYGLTGAVLGGPAGVAVGVVAVVVYFMAVCAVSLACGIDPFVVVGDAPPRQGGDGPDDRDP